MVALALTVALVLPAQAEPCEGLPVGLVEVGACESPSRPCEPDTRASLVSLTDLAIGQTWLPANVARASRRLLETGYFAQVTPRCAPDATGIWAEVRFDTVLNHRIRRVRFVGNANLYDSDLLRRLFLRPGTVFNPGDPRTEVERTRQEALLARRYAKEGFGAAKVMLSAEVLSPEAVDLEVIIDEGRRRKVGGVDVVVDRAVGSQAPFGPDIRCPDFSARMIRSASKLEASEPYTERRRREAERTLGVYLRSRGVLDPSVTITASDEAERTKVSIRFERCAVLRVLERDEPQPGRSGTVERTEAEVLDALTFGESGSFDLEEADLSRAALELYYQRLGYLFADVELDYRVAPEGSRAPGVVAVITYVVSTRWPKEIRRIDLVGDLGLPRETLEGLMKTKVYDFFGTGGYLLVEQLFADLAAIQRHLVEAGYHEARFPGAPPGARELLEVRQSLRGTDDVYDYVYGDLHFRVVSPPGENVLYLEVPIAAGPASRVGTVDVTLTPGLAGPTVAELRTALRTLPGDPFSAAGVADDAAALELMWQALGHHETRVEVHCVARDVAPADGAGAERRGDGPLAARCGPDRREPCDRARCDFRTVRAGEVDLAFDVVPGPLFSVGEVFVLGLETTSEALVREALPRPGEPLSQPGIDAANRELRLLGVFADVRLDLIGLDEEPPRERPAVAVHLQEAPYQFFELRTGIQTLVARSGDEGVPELGGAVSSSLGASDALVMGGSAAVPLEIPNFLNFWGAAYRNSNLFGRAIELEVPIRYGLSIPESATDPDAWSDAFSRLVELRPTLSVARLRGTELGLRVSPFVRYDRSTREFDEFESGVATALDAALTARLRSSTTLTVSGIASGDACDVEPCTLPEMLGREAPLSPKVDLDVGLAYDRLDSPIHPTQGWAVGGRLRYVLSEGTDERGDTGDIGNFLLYELNARGVVNVRKRLIVAAFARFASALSFGGEENLPNRYRYRLGGISGLRGLADNSVRTFSVDGTPNLVQEGGDTLLMGTLELRVPLLERGLGGLWLGMFVDFGGLAEDVIDFNEESFRLTAGVGLRYLISGIAVRLDVGFNPLRRCEIATGVSEPTCDANVLEPVSQTHFGLLYTF